MGATAGATAGSTACATAGAADATAGTTTCATAGAMIGGTLALVRVDLRSSLSHGRRPFPQRFLIYSCAWLLFGPFVTQAASFGTTQPLPVCDVADEAAPEADYEDWATTLLDTHYRLQADYLPPDLRPLTDAGLEGNHRLRALALPALQALTEAAAAAGHPIAVQSAYRSYDYQVSTFQYWVDLEGYEAALASSARPGHSEHQLGTAVDLRSADGPAAWDLDDWGATPTGGWVAANAWRYGFVMSYPRGYVSETCYVYEPWHYRYVGVEQAQALHDSGLPLRTWLWARLQRSHAAR